MSFGGKLSLRAKFASAVWLLIIFVTVVFGGIVGQYSVYQLRESIGQSLTVDAQRVADRLAALVREKSGNLALLSLVESFQTHSDVSPELEALQRSDLAFSWIALTNSQGSVSAATEPNLVGTAIALSSNQRHETRSPGAPSSENGRLNRFGELPPPSLERQRQLSLGQPIRGSDGTLDGMLVGRLSWTWLTSNIDSMLSVDERGQSNRELIIVSGFDTVLAGPPYLVGRSLSLPEINRARAGIYGWSEGEWPSDGEFISGTSSVSSEGQALGLDPNALRWTILVRESAAIAFAPAQQLRLAIFLLGFIISTVVAIIGWIVAGVITRPLRLIAAAADRLRRGEDVELPILRSSLEVESLSASLRALVATLTFKQGRLDELEAANQLDPLTALLNRAGLQAWLVRALARARTDPSGLLILVGDLDGFKQINDNYGHAIGDRLLKEVARRLQSGVRARDAVGRMGGDEFVVVLHAPQGLADQLAVDAAHRLWSRVTEPYIIDGRKIVIGFSLGGAGWPEDDRDVDGTIIKADAALYNAKRTGKGRIVFHREAILR